MRLRHTLARRSAAAALAVAATCSVAACSATAPDFGSGPDDVVGAPVELVAQQVAVRQVPGASLITGMDAGPDGSLLALSAPGPEGDGGSLVRITGSGVEELASIPVGDTYRQAAARTPQVARGWAVGSLVDADGDRTEAALVSTGARWGFMDEVSKARESGAFTGIDVIAAGADVVTGTCSLSGGQVPLALTADGSAYLTKRTGSPLDPGATSSALRMSVDSRLGVRGEQAPETVPGPRAVPALPGRTALVPGLTDLDCLRGDQLDSLASAGVPRLGSAGVVAVVDRALGQAWYDSGRTPEQSRGQGLNEAGLPIGWRAHRTGQLVGEPTGTGPNRLDAVVVDTDSSTVVATLRLEGPGVLNDAQVGAIAMDPADGSHGWASVLGSDVIIEFRIGKAPAE